MNCPRCDIPMKWVDIQNSPYINGHWLCTKCGLEISKK